MTVFFGLLFSGEPVCNNSGKSRGNNILSLEFPGTIKYCLTVDDLGVACEALISQAERKGKLAIGLDAEWPVSYQRGPEKIALIQACSDESICYLFHISRMGRLPEVFQSVIEHPNIWLVGNCIHNDIWKIGRDFNIPVSKIIESDRVVDLGKLANQVLHCSQRWSLERLALHLMSVKIDKRDSIRKSRWDVELSKEQQVYAATDAYVSLMIYKILKDKEVLAQ